MVLYCSWIILLYKSINPGASAAEKILWISSIFLTSFNIENLNFVQLDWHMFLWIVYIWIVNKCIAFYLKSSSCELFCLCYILCIVVSLHVYIPLHKSHNTILSNKCKCIKNADVWRKKWKYGFYKILPCFEQAFAQWLTWWSTDELCIQKPYCGCSFRKYWLIH